MVLYECFRHLYCLTPCVFITSVFPNQRLPAACSVWNFSWQLLFIPQFQLICHLFLECSSCPFQVKLGTILLLQWVFLYHVMSSSPTSATDSLKRTDLEDSHWIFYNSLSHTTETDYLAPSQKKPSPFLDSILRPAGVPLTDRKSRLWERSWSIILSRLEFAQRCCVGWSVVNWSHLDRRNLNWEITSIRLADRQVCEAFSYWVINM